MSENKVATTNIYCQMCEKLIKNIHRHIKLTGHTAFILGFELTNPHKFQKFITDIFSSKKVKT